MSDFRRPLGLALAGGGALGAWQAGCLEALTESGLVFDKVLGFSAGSLTGAAYCFGQQQELVRRWREVDSFPVLRFKPSLFPFALFSGSPIWDNVQLLADEAAMKTQARCELTVMSLDVEGGITEYSRFTPGGERGWDGPLPARLVASCAIPWVFPAVRLDKNGSARTYIDGGIPGREWMRFDSLDGCADVIVLDMVHPEDLSARVWSPLGYYDRLGRRTCSQQIDRGIESASSWTQPPRVFWVCPSKSLSFTMLDFRSRVCGPAVDQGLCDGGFFLANPSAALAGAIAAASRTSTPTRASVLPEAA